MIMQVFQTLVTRWITRCFGDESSKDKRERTHRFLEEALELAQAAGATPHEAHALVEYVYSRPAGKPEQEVGGVLLTLAGFCTAHGFDLHRCAAMEIGRVNRPEVIEKCRVKQAAKKADPLASPLPGQPTAPVHGLCGSALLDVRISSDTKERWYCPQCRVEVLAENTVPA